MVSFNLICVIFNSDCSDGFDSDDSFDSYPPFPLLLKQDTPKISLISKKIGAIKFYVPKIVCSKSYGFKKFVSKITLIQKILGKKNCVTIKFWIQNNVGSKILDPRRI